MNGLLEKLKVLMKHRSAWLWVGGALFFVFIFVFSSKDKPKKTDIIVKETKKSVKTSGLFLDQEVDRKAFVGRLEDQYHGAQEKSRQIEQRIDLLDKKLLDLAKGQGVINENFSGLEAKISESIKKSAESVTKGPDDGAVNPLNYRLEVVNITPVSAPEAEGIYLPAGSFVRGTLLTGVYAPADQNNPLPVLIRLNEAFYGPNETRIPLEGAFLVGKASGELNSERALIQAVTLSAVLPDGKEFQHQGNIGYITDIHGELGIKGVVVRNTGGQMAASFMAGFLGGGAQAIADGETTAVTTSGGRVSRNVTGDVGKHAAFQGMSQSAAQLSKYYADQVNAIVPAVRVDAGIDVYLVVLEGVRINGLHVHKPSDAHYLD